MFSALPPLHRYRRHLAADSPSPPSRRLALAVSRSLVAALAVSRSPVARAALLVRPRPHGCGRLTRAAWRVGLSPSTSSSRSPVATAAFLSSRPRRRRRGGRLVSCS
ncbi:hypothetical protein Scep_011931 [Stephania cephalantha]|uniref:Uncharacterized protein n=1 Tax=Stephania cephalantha TaxID=152367 RepID=A0AAP0JE94_9MAGN